MNVIVESVDTIIKNDIIDYFRFRKYHEPNTLQAFLWTVSEMGELAEVLSKNMAMSRERTVLFDMVRLGHEAEDVLTGKTDHWVRNNPDGHREESLAAETGDVLMMLYKFAEKAGVSPFTALISKMETKGWTGEGSMSSYTGGKHG